MMKILKEFNEWRQFKAEQEARLSIHRGLDMGLTAMFQGFAETIKAQHEAGQRVDVMQATLSAVKTPDGIEPWMAKHMEGDWDILAIRQGSDAHAILMAAEKNAQTVAMFKEAEAAEIPEPTDYKEE